eukprot:TRINITY_DN18659_c0_g1_i1.p1 TRINITY_DN18659_c0_g1~~TRINITY_DN18659_c0_g1_i1.p1  ORF type:complete len:996 (-),score=218.28 TRINITY_DN18659_c0_g1_i1:411-3314(-)
MADFSPEADVELHLTEGQRVWALADPAAAGWTKVINENSDEGLAPTAYLRHSDTPLDTPLATVSRPFHENKDEQFGDGECLKVTADFSPEADVELHLTEGQRVWALADPAAAGWTKVINENSDEGLAPTAYLRHSDTPLSSISRSGARSVGEASQDAWSHFEDGDYVKALADYVAADEDELSIVAGQKLWILPDPVDPGWVKVIDQDCKEGLAPKSYLAHSFTPVDGSMTPNEPPTPGGHDENARGENVASLWIMVQSETGQTGKVPSSHLAAKRDEMGAISEGQEASRDATPSVVRSAGVTQRLESLQQASLQGEAEVEILEQPYPQIEPPQSESQSGETRYMLSNFEAMEKEELSIAGGETVEILPGVHPDGWTMVKNQQGKEGLVPTSYLSKDKSSEATHLTHDQLQLSEILADFDAEAEGELTVREGQEIWIVPEVMPDGWTKVRNIRGEEGIVPTSYLALEGAAADATIGGGESLRSGTGEANVLAEALVGVSAGDTCRIIMSFEAADASELSVMKGETVEVTDAAMHDEGWSMVKNNQGQEGLVPTSYLQTTTGKGSEVASQAGSDFGQLAAGDCCQIVKDFVAADPDELGVKEGQYVWILSNFDGWTRCVDEKSQEGLVPTSYLEKVRTSSKNPAGDTPRSNFSAASVSRLAQFTVLADFHAEDPKELTVAEGQTVYAWPSSLDPAKVQDWTEVRSSTGEQGFVPTGYLIALGAGGSSSSVSSAWVPQMAVLKNDCAFWEVKLEKQRAEDRLGFTHISGFRWVQELKGNARTGAADGHGSLADAPQVLIVLDIAPSPDLLGAWNLANNGSQVKPYDRICEVNGKTTIDEMQEQLTRSSTWVLKFQRYPPTLTVKLQPNPRFTNFGIHFDMQDASNELLITEVESGSPMAEWNESQMRSGALHMLAMPSEVQILKANGAEGSCEQLKQVLSSGVPVELTLRRKERGKSNDGPVVKKGNLFE